MLGLRTENFWAMERNMLGLFFKRVRTKSSLMKLNYDEFYQILRRIDAEYQPSKSSFDHSRSHGDFNTA